MDVQSDFVVIGSGVAGLNFALRAAEVGRVAVVTKKEAMESNTNLAQGGIAAVFDGDDSFAFHIQDTLASGAGLCRREVVELVVREGPARIRELVNRGVSFCGDPEGSGGFDLGRSAVLPALGALGVRRLDLLVVSHADLDHRGGVPAVLMALPVGRVWLPPGGRSDPALSAVMDAARAREVPVLERGRGAAALRLGDLRVVPLWPPLRRPGGSRNEGSLVLRIDVAGRRVLLPGDLGVASERVLLEAAHELPADVLKLPHHGSRTSSSDAFLAAVAADLVVASAPRFGRVGMPHAAVVERVGRNGAALWWTGRDGAVAVALGPTLWARGFR